MSPHHFIDRACQSIALAMVLLFATCASGQSGPTDWDKITSQSKPDDIATALWKTILTQCKTSDGDVAYFYAGPRHENRTGYEYRKADFPRLAIKQERISTADQLNGVQWRFTTNGHAGAYSYLSFNNRKWSEWL